MANWSPWNLMRFIVAVTLGISRFSRLSIWSTLGMNPTFELVPLEILFTSNFEVCMGLVCICIFLWIDEVGILFFMFRKDALCIYRPSPVAWSWAKLAKAVPSMAARDLFRPTAPWIRKKETGPEGFLMILHILWQKNSKHIILIFFLSVLSWFDQQLKRMGNQT